jgi:hypothetical protein
MPLASSCTGTLWDNNWEHTLRRVLLSFVEEETMRFKTEQCDRLFDALSACNCTTVQQAHALTCDSPVLQNLPEDLKCRFIALIAAAAQGWSFIDACAAYSGA